MTNEIKGGPSALKSDKDTKTVTLSFTGEAEIDLYNKLSDEAEEDERTLSRYIVRKLKNIAE